MKSLKDINWNQVHCFYEVSRKQSMKEAARLLGISTPTVSEQIKRLEEMLGVKLFNRLPRRLELTPEGKALYNCSREIFDAGGRFLDCVSPDFVGGYSARVGIHETIAIWGAINFVSRYWDLFTPFGTVNTIRMARPESLFEALLNGNVDWGVSLERPRSQRLSSLQIMRAEVVFACSPEVYRRFAQPSDILRALPLARNPHDHLLNELVDDCLRAAGVFPEEYVESEHRELCASLAKNGRCVTTFSVEGLSTADFGAHLKSFSLGESIPLPLYAVWLKGSERMITTRKLLELINDGNPAPPDEAPEVGLA